MSTLWPGYSQPTGTFPSSDFSGNQTSSNWNQYNGFGGSSGNCSPSFSNYGGQSTTQQPECVNIQNIFSQPASAQCQNSGNSSFGGMSMLLPLMMMLFSSFQNGNTVASSPSCGCQQQPCGCQEQHQCHHATLDTPPPPPPACPPAPVPPPTENAPKQGVGGSCQSTMHGDPQFTGPNGTINFSGVGTATTDDPNNYLLAKQGNTAMVGNIGLDYAVSQQANGQLSDTHPNYLTGMNLNLDGQIVSLAPSTPDNRDYVATLTAPSNGATITNADGTTQNVTAGQSVQLQAGQSISYDTGAVDNGNDVIGNFTVNTDGSFSLNAGSFISNITPVSQADRDALNNVTLDPTSLFDAVPDGSNDGQAEALGGIFGLLYANDPNGLVNSLISSSDGVQTLSNTFSVGTGSTIDYSTNKYLDGLSQTVPYGTTYTGTGSSATGG